MTSGGPRARLGRPSPPTGPARGAPAPSPVPALTRPAPLGRLPGPRRHGSRAPGRRSSPRPPCRPHGAGLVLRSGAGGQRGGGRDRGGRGRARGRGSAGRGRLGVRAGAAAAHRAGGRGGEQSRFRFRSRYAHTRMTSDAPRWPRPRRGRGLPAYRLPECPLADTDRAEPDPRRFASRCLTPAAPPGWEPGKSRSLPRAGTFIQPDSRPCFGLIGPARPPSSAGSLPVGLLSSSLILPFRVRSGGGKPPPRQLPGEMRAAVDRKVFSPSKQHMQKSQRVQE